MSIRLDLTGHVYGRLTVLEFDSASEKKKKHWICKCICGNIKSVSRDNLRSGKTKSCGCLAKETAIKALSDARAKNPTHGMGETRFYRIWQSMKQRCLNEKNDNYYIYGGKGISIYDPWLKFEGFRDDMLESYNLHVEKFGEDDTSIDRRDGGRGYFPDNVRWATLLEQNNNTNRNRLVEYNGRTQSLTQWATELNIDSGLLFSRILILGWSTDKALSTPSKGKQKMVTYNGKTQSITDWSKETGINRVTLSKRLNDNNFTIEEAFEKPVKSVSHLITFRGETKNIKEWAETLNVDGYALTNRLRRHWSIEKTLTTPIKIQKGGQKAKTKQLQLFAENIDKKIL